MGRGVETGQDGVGGGSDGLGSCAGAEGVCGDRVEVRAAVGVCVWAREGKFVPSDPKGLIHPGKC